MSTSNRLPQFTLVAVAGVMAFYAAFQWQRSSSTAQQSIVEAAPRSAKVSVASESQVIVPPERDPTLSLPNRTRVVPDAKGDAFTALSWLPPPPPVRVAPAAPPVPPPPPPAPVAPPLPFTFVGLIEQGSSKPQAFLSRGDTLLVVAAGDMLDNNTYRVDTLTPQQIVITYLPLNTPQTLNISGTAK